jgi:hypothetical protein
LKRKTVNIVKGYDTVAVLETDSPGNDCLVNQGGTHKRSKKDGNNNNDYSNMFFVSFMLSLFFVIFLEA